MIAAGAAGQSRPPASSPLLRQARMAALVGSRLSPHLSSRLPPDPTRCKARVPQLPARTVLVSQSTSLSSQGPRAPVSGQDPGPGLHPQTCGQGGPCGCVSWTGQKTVLWTEQGPQARLWGFPSADLLRAEFFPSPAASPVSGLTSADAFSLFTVGLFILTGSCTEPTALILMKSKLSIFFFLDHTL